MTIQPGNLFADVADVSSANVGEEAFSEILARPGLKIERIISQEQTSPPGFWYDQAWNGDAPTWMRTALGQRTKPLAR